MGTLEPVVSTSDYLDKLRRLGVNGKDSPWWFRGHRDDAYVLQASIYRPTPGRQHERSLLKRFMQDARSHLSEPPSHWEWIFVAQHHGVPTRLLDWTESALVALYFACEADVSAEPEADPVDGAVWVLQPTALNESAWRGSNVFDIPMLGVDRLLEEYHPLPSMPVAEERVLAPVAALASRNFGRIASQWGTFTISADDKPLEDVAAHALHRLVVDGSFKEAMIDELSYLGIQERNVYPDLHRLGARVKEMFS